MSEQLNIAVTGTFKDELTAAIAKTKGSLESLKTATEELAKTSDKSSTSSTKAASGFDKMKSSLQTVGEKTKAFATALPGIINGLGNVATSAVMLYRNYRDLSDAQIAVDRTARRVSVAQQAQRKAQEKVNKLVEEGKTDTPEYAEALVDLEQANQNVSVATDMNSEALEAQSDAYQDFYLSVIPGVLGVLGTLASTFQGVKAAQMAAGTATTQMTTAMKAMRVVMVALPLAAIAGGLLAIRNNTFGFRDALEDLGVKIGNAVPQLQGFLTWLHDLGEALGLTGGKLDLSKAWDLFVSGFQSAWNTVTTMDWGQLLGEMVQKIEDFLNDPDAWQKAGELIMEGIEGGCRMDKKIYCSNDRKTRRLDLEDNKRTR